MKTKTAKTILRFIFITVVLLIFQQLASKIGGAVADLFNYSRIDPDNTFAYVSVHHIVQMIIAVIAIIVISKTVHLQFNMKWIFSKVGLKYTAIFTGIYAVYVLISYIIGYKIGSVQPYNYTLNAINIMGTLGFQLLLSGPSEEILFRALPITVLLQIQSNDKNKKAVAPIVCAAVLFSLAHVKWSLSPLYITADWFQLVLALALGIVYGITYIKSKSIIYPMIMHSMSNVLMVGTGYIFMALN